MGYQSTVRGRLTVAPPIPYMTLATSRFFPSNRTVTDRLTDVKYEVAANPVPDLPGAVLPVVVAIVPIGDEQLSFYDLAADLSAAITEVRTAGSTVDGEFVRIGEAQGDVERYRVSSDGTVRETAELRWADGTSVGAL